MDLVKWMVENGVQLSKRLELKPSKLGGTGVFAKELIKAESVVLQVPKSMILSPRTCGIGNLLDEAQQEDGMPDLLALVAAYLFERDQGKNSPWHPFIAFIEEAPLPDVPRLWPDAEKNVLKGTEIDAFGGLDTNELAEGYSTIAEFFAKNDLGMVTLKELQEAIVRVGSRAFVIDNYHGEALVPGACLFNHSDSESIHFTTEESVCDLCGKAFCSCQDPGSADDSEGANESQDSLAEDDDAEDSEEGSDDDDDDVCEMISVNTIRAGAEVFNTYGGENNSVLLAKYGFVVPGNRLERVHVVDEVKKYAKLKGLRDRLKFWQANHEKLAGHDGDVTDADAEWDDGLYFNLSGPSESLDLLLAIFSLDARHYFLLEQTGKLRPDPAAVADVWASILRFRHALLLSQIERVSSHALAENHRQVVLDFLNTQRQLIEQLAEGDD